MLLLLVFASLKLAATQDYCNRADAEALLAAVFDRYKDNNQLQYPPNYPVDVNATIIVNKLAGVDEIQGCAQFSFGMVRMWRDRRLAFGCLETPLTIPVDFQARIWSPEIFIASLVHGYVIKAPLEVRRMALYKDGTIKSVITMTNQAYCSGNYVTFPFDTISCQLYITGNIPESLVRLKWMGGKPVVFPDWIDISNFDMANYSYEIVVPMPENVSDPLSLVSLKNTRAHWVKLQLDRKYSSYLLLIYLPNSITVLVAWLSLLFPPPPNTTRISICLSCLIVIMLQYASLAQQLPRVGYIKGVDVWMLFCFLFILQLIFHFALLSYRAHMQKQNETCVKKPFEKVENNSKKPRDYRLDTYFRHISLIVFISFSVGYFGWNYWMKTRK